jgi:hypothetical protein
VLGLDGWVFWIVPFLMFLVITLVGLLFLRALGGGRPREEVEPEDVSDLDVFLVCAECGTEYQVTRVGEVQIPRHCGEPMALTRRPRAQPQLN